MKIRLLFLTALLTINMGWSQDILDRFENYDVGINIEYSLVRLSDNSAVISKTVMKYHSIQDEDFVISPNPAEDKLNIKLLSANENVKLEVFDVLGKLIYKGEITQLESSVNISNWKSGVYLVRVSNNKSTQTKRFIKQ
jgi:hypothetical protein